VTCEYCQKNPHDSRCPLSPKNTRHYCSFCGEGIYEGEEYIENDDGEYIHYDCPTTRVLLEFLGYKIQEMRCED
jgi:hypothetical protein